MAAKGALKRQIKRGQTPEQAFAAIAAKHKTVQDMSTAMKCHHATVIHWLKKYGYKKDPVSGYWVKQSDQPQSAA